MLKAITDSLLSVAFPQHCHICSRPVEKRSDGVACANCWASTRIFDATIPVCAKCGNLLASGRASQDLPCTECTDHHYDTAFAAGVYEHALAATVLELKKTPYLPERVRGLLSEVFELPALGAIDLVIPVPLSPRRRVERGFNQAEVIGRLISDRYSIELDTFTLIRHKHTPMHRVAMDSKAREQSVKNAFSVARPSMIQDKSVLLVDDVLTTGSTVSHCASELKKNGAAAVNVLTLARAVRSYF